MPKDKERKITMPCRACEAEIAFAVTKKGKNMPINAESLSEFDTELLSRGEKIQFRFKEHEPHWNTCPDAADFRQKLEDQKQNR